MLSGTANRRLLPLVAITGLCLVVLDASGFGPIESVRRSALAAGGPIGTVLHAVTSPAVGAWDGAVHHEGLIEENRELRRRLAEAQGRLAAQPDLALELEALSAAIDVAYGGDIDRVTARVVADRRGGVERIVELDKGSDDGLATGMPVVTGSGLVGVIDEAIADRSVVRLVTSPRSAVGVRTRFGFGVVTGQGDGTLRLAPDPDLAAAIEQGRVGPGHRLVTSGLERSRFPSGLPVALLAPSASADDADAPPILATADLDVLGYLTVLLVDRPA